MRISKMMTLMVVTVSVVLLTGVTAWGQTTRYVDDDASTNGNGQSWATAYKRLQDALHDADTNGGTTEIHVAQGTYKPDQDEGGNIIPGDRTETLQLIDGVALYGGYAGIGAPDPDVRDIDSNATVLSGDLAGDDGPGHLDDFLACYSHVMPLRPGCEPFDSNSDGDVDYADLLHFLDANNYTENSYHVVAASNTSPTTVLNGFTITGGNANGDGADRNGAGLYNSFGSLTLTDCTFTGNTAARDFSGNGGAMYNDHGDSTLTNCTFSGNFAFRYGGGIHSSHGTLTLNNCTLCDNSSVFYGGGIIGEFLASMTLRDCVFTRNTTGGGGGLRLREGGSATLINCSFNKNLATFEPGGGILAGGGLTLINCIFTGNSGGYYGGGGIYHDGGGGGSLAMLNCVFSGNVATHGYGGGGGVLSLGQLTATNCTFAGNFASMGGGMYGQFYHGVSLLTNCIFWGNSDDGGTHEPGQIFVDSGTPRVDYCCIQGWSGDLGGSGNIDADPLFVDSNGPDDIPGTEDDDLRLLPSSPSIDAGTNGAVTATTDLDGNPRIVDGDGDDEVIVDMGAYEFRPANAFLDIKPGSCPNPLNRASHGILPVAVVGSETFDVTAIDVYSVGLSRADGIGGAVAPNEGPPGPHSTFEDMATPFEGEPCDCHALEGDGIIDLSLKFRTDDLVDVLELDDLLPGALVELVLSGTLADGGEFVASDCVRIVPQGASPALLIVQSNAPGAWLDVTPLDDTLDGGGFADFERSYAGGSVVTLMASPTHNGLVFAGWELDGARVGEGLTLTVTLPPDETVPEAVYVPVLRLPVPAQTPTPVHRPAPRPVSR